MRGQKVPEDVKRKVIEAIRLGGKSYKTIGKEFNLPHQTVAGIKKRSISKRKTKVLDNPPYSRIKKAEEPVISVIKNGDIILKAEDAAKIMIALANIVNSGNRI